MHTPKSISLAYLLNAAFAWNFDSSSTGPFHMEESSYSNDNLTFSSKSEHRNLKHLITPFVKGTGLPVQMFSSTASDKFTELSYQTIKNLVLPKFDLFNPIIFAHKNIKSKCENFDSEIYNLLLHIINTISPSVFDIYYDAFKSEKYFECFLILQRLYSCDSDIERSIFNNILSLNKRFRRQTPTCINFIDASTGDVCTIELPVCQPVSCKVCLSLPKQVLRFEELVQFSFQLDESIMADVDRVCPLGFRKIHHALVKRFYRGFENMHPEQRILFFLRIKFFVFNSIGYSISYLSSGSKNHVYDLLIRTAKSENDAFFKAYACALGLLNK